MALSANRKWIVSSLATTALSTVLYWFGIGLQPHAWLTWLAPLPILLLAPYIRAPWLALAACVAGALGGLSQWHYLHHVIVLPLGVILLIIITPGVVLALCVLLFQKLLRAGHGLAATLAMPALWVAIDYASSLLSPHGTFGNIGYTQMNALPVIQIAAVTGLWGIGFLLLLIPAAIAVVLGRGTGISSRTRLYVGGIALLSLGLSLGYGYWRLQASAIDTLRVGLVSLEKPIRPALNDPSGQALMQRYTTAIDRLAAAGARAVVIPETSFATADATIPGFADSARRNGLTMVAGIDFQGVPQSERNMVMVFRPNVMSPAIYSKHHLIPGYEDQYKPGTDYTMLDGTPRIGLAICKDMDFHDIGQAYAARDAQLLFVPAWDFGADGWLHSRMAVMRGVESGFAIARVARTGRLTLSDDRGRVVAEASSEGSDAELVGDLPLRDTHTLYARWGDWFAWLDLVLLIALLAWAVVPSRR